MLCILQTCTDVKTRKLLGIITGKLQKSRANRGARPG
jgi:hypothetical protein